MKIDSITVQQTMTAGELDALQEVYVEREIAKTGLPFSVFLSDPNEYIQHMNRLEQKRASSPHGGAMF